MDAALKLLYSTLQPVIQDAEQDPPSAAYKTFFKDIASAPYIRSVLSNITTGAAVSLDGSEHTHSTDLNSGTPTHSPEVICISKPGQLVYHLPDHSDLTDHYELCKTRTDGGTAAFMADTPYLVLCPSFFSLDPAPSAPLCPHVNRWLNQYSIRDGGKRLIHYQIFALLHVLAQFYFWAASHRRVNVIGINQCTGLEARLARENSRSYEFYVASESDSS